MLWKLAWESLPRLKNYKINLQRIKRPRNGHYLVAGRDVTRDCITQYRKSECHPHALGQQQTGRWAERYRGCYVPHDTAWCHMWSRPRAAPAQFADGWGRVLRPTVKGLGKGGRQVHSHSCPLLHMVQVTSCYVDCTPVTVGVVMCYLLVFWPYFGCIIYMDASMTLHA